MTTISISNCDNGYLVSATHGFLSIGPELTLVFSNLDDVIKWVREEFSEPNNFETDESPDLVKEEMEKINKKIEED